MRTSQRIQLRSYRRALQNVAVFMFLVAASLLVTIYGLFRIKSRIPSSIVFSLTSEQVFQSSNIDDVLNSLKEERFQDHFRADNPLIEVHSIKSLLVRQFLDLLWICCRGIAIQQRGDLMLNVLEMRHNNS